MRHFLSTFLAFHWAVAFALLAVACVSVGEGNASALGMIGWAAHGLPDAIVSGPALAAMLALCFATISVLFLWALLTTFFGGDGDGDEQVIKMAFGGGCSALTLVLVLGAVEAATGLFPVVAAVLAALLASYVAICAERLSASMSEVPGESDIRAAARVMAAGAAHSSMLSRLSGRADLKPDGSR